MGGGGFFILLDIIMYRSAKHTFAQNICQLGCILPATVDCRHITHAKYGNMYMIVLGFIVQKQFATCTVELRKDCHTLTHH